MAAWYKRKNGKTGKMVHFRELGAVLGMVKTNGDQYVAHVATLDNPDWIEIASRSSLTDAQYEASKRMNIMHLDMERQNGKALD